LQVLWAAQIRNDTQRKCNILEKMDLHDLGELAGSLWGLVYPRYE